MNIEKFLGSKTRAGIIKYLLFKRQGISMRALETDLAWSFTAIKKQVDSLLEADIVTIKKDQTKWSIYINDQVYDLVRRIFLYSLEFELQKTFSLYPGIVEKYYLGKIFGNNINADMVVVYKTTDPEFLSDMKNKISEIFVDYYIDNVGVVFMQSGDFQRRYRLADKFVLNLITNS
ncbi:hypothetical protein [Candidatus Absconditicoccus praedator]|uniref:hypothetical protein n=1 Tax=Candidatus Absconditicoccus praedator TaxID=2735562 RepID=UPI001E60E62D|nr:hypothetical protein [Candidatus Absconditicoccus praedator]UFX83381.1 hypothetical protein HLG78_04600 [Candidatus Absconditicoccus praedator]